MTRVKICGITNLEDALGAVELGADALGFVFYGKSPRCVDVRMAREIVSKLPPFVTAVGVFVNEDPEVVNSTVREAGLDRVQLHGDEPPGYLEGMEAKVIKAFRVKERADIERIRPYRACAFLLDTYRPSIPGGTGKTFDWEIAVEAKRFGSIILSGGLTPENVSSAIEKVRPYGVDVSSGVESRPGKKDLEKVRRFIEAARGAGINL